MDKAAIIKLLEAESHECTSCGRTFSLSSHKRESLINFKIHLKQVHKVGIVEYVGYAAESKCCICEKEPSIVKIEKDPSTLKVSILETGLCNNRSCIDIRKKMNPNSFEWISKSKGVSLQEAKDILHANNKSPFYRSNFESEEDYLQFQRRVSPLSRDYYKDRVNDKTGEVFTEREIDISISSIQHDRALKAVNRNQIPMVTTLPGFVGKFGEEEGKVRYLNWLESLQNRPTMPRFSQEWYDMVYVNGGKESYEHRINYIEWMGSREYLVFTLGLDKYEDHLTNIERNTVVSKIGLKFVLEIAKAYKGDLPLFFGDKERRVFIKETNSLYSLDFAAVNKDKSRKYAIEFFGDFYHANPNRYTENVILRGKPAKHYWARDSARLEAIRSKGYKTKVVWESDYESDPERHINECLEFLES